jgi:hypothetical protein
VDYSLKAKWAQPPVFGKTLSTLMLEDQIHPEALTKKVLYRTHYSAMGWGSCQLSINEVGGT